MSIDEVMRKKKEEQNKQSGPLGPAVALKKATVPPTKGPPITAPLNAGPQPIVPFTVPQPVPPFTVPQPVPPFAPGKAQPALPGSSTFPIVNTVRC